ncbi:uncharacterized protein LY79DRAFT_251021 [Colletotrichum navitas]|uniref:Uncharacterized protein n=1 Tax=Colletotrichum navitas TaxID=681940 RepID=A0AAD8QCS2_9PEZI|nr:uncharacterized protein LY79DRAFT_251021 [Colletotrichum navitas]KAK1598649.1 hypothetical protein LY79DRAFT_251021 [Colletotrichum navitas]
MQCLIRWSSLRFFYVQFGDPSLISHIHRLETKQPFRRRHSASSAYQVPSQSRRRRLGATSWWPRLLASRGSAPQGKQWTTLAIYGLADNTRPLFLAIIRAVGTGSVIEIGCILLPSPRNRFDPAVRAVRGFARRRLGYHSLPPLQLGARPAKNKFCASLAAGLRAWLDAFLYANGLDYKSSACRGWTFPASRRSWALCYGLDTSPPGCTTNTQPLCHERDLCANLARLVPALASEAQSTQMRLGNN